MKAIFQSFLHSIKLTFALLLLTLAKAFSEYTDVLVHQLFDVERGQLKHVPNFVIFLIYILCLSVLFQAGLDLLIEVLMLGGFIEKIPLRVNFIFLTLISTVMGVQTLKGLSHRKLDVTRNSILIGIVVETALIVGDSFLMITEFDALGPILYLRIPFLSLTLMNLLILTYVARRLKVFRDRKGRLQLF